MYLLFYLGKYQVFTIGARPLYLPVKLKRVYNGGPLDPGFSEIILNSARKVGRLGRLEGPEGPEEANDQGAS